MSEYDYKERIEKINKMPFFTEGGEYRIHDNIFTVHKVLTTVYGPVAFASFPRGPGVDVQTLCMANYDEAEQVGWNNGWTS